MPWTCTTCGCEVTDDASSCPTCAVVKTTWTVAFDQTRSLVIARKKFSCLKGDCGRSYQPDHPLQEGVELSEAKAAVATSKARLRAIQEAGELPPTANVLFVALHPAGARQVQVTVEVMFAGMPSVEHVVTVETPADLPQGDPFYATFLFVYGPEDVSDVTFDGLHILDVSEEGETGFAPTVEVSAFGRTPVELPLAPQPTKEYAFSG